MVNNQIDINNRTLLVLPSNLKISHGGTIMIKSLLTYISSEHIYLAITGTNSDYIPPWLRHYKSLIMRSKIFSPIWLKLSRRLRLGFLNGILIYYIYPHIYKKILAKYIRINDISQIWIIGSRHTYMLAYNLLNTTSTPIHLSIYDDITGNMIPGEYRLIKNKYAEILSRANSLDVISTYLASHLKKYYGVDRSDIGIFWIGPVNYLTPKAEVRERPCRIVFAGNIWSPHEILQFSSCVERYCELEEAIEFSIYSYWDYTELFKKNKYVKCMGYIHESEIITEMQKHDYVYVPMSFKDSHKTISSTSLPSKIITALQAGVPILAHGPDYATNVKFTAINEIGYSINSIEIEEIYNTLKIAIQSDLTTRKKMSEREIVLYAEQFNTELNSKKFISKYLQK